MLRGSLQIKCMYSKVVPGVQSSLQRIKKQVVWSMIDCSKMLKTRSCDRIGCKSSDHSSKLWSLKGISPLIEWVKKIWSIGFTQTNVSSSSNVISYLTSTKMWMRTYSKTAPSNLNSNAHDRKILTYIHEVSLRLRDLTNISPAWLHPARKCHDEKMCSAK